MMTEQELTIHVLEIKEIRKINRLNSKANKDRDEMKIQIS